MAEPRRSYHSQIHRVDPRGATALPDTSTGALGTPLRVQSSPGMATTGGGAPQAELFGIKWYWYAAGIGLVLVVWLLTRSSSSTSSTASTTAPSTAANNQLNQIQQELQTLNTDLAQGSNPLPIGGGGGGGGGSSGGGSSGGGGGSPGGGGTGGGPTPTPTQPFSPNPDTLPLPNPAGVPQKSSVTYTPTGPPSPSHLTVPQQVAVASTHNRPPPAGPPPQTRIPSGGLGLGFLPGGFGTGIDGGYTHPSVTPAVSSGRQGAATRPRGRSQARSSAPTNQRAAILALHNPNHL